MITSKVLSALNDAEFQQIQPVWMPESVKVTWCNISESLIVVSDWSRQYSKLKEAFLTNYYLVNANNCNFGNIPIFPHFERLLS